MYCAQLITKALPSKLPATHLQTLFLGFAHISKFLGSIKYLLDILKSLIGGGGGEFCEAPSRQSLVGGSTKELSRSLPKVETFGSNQEINGDFLTLLFPTVLKCTSQIISFAKTNQTLGQSNLRLLRFRAQVGANSSAFQCARTLIKLHLKKSK